MKIKSNLKYYKHIHFIGIGGISLSGLAKLCLHNNITVSGSDLSPSRLTDKLQLLGGKIYHKHKAKNIAKSVDLVVYSSAINSNNPELNFAKQKKIKTLDRADFLNEVVKNYKNIIAVGGMHGKTTTCGMLASIFIQANQNPTVHIGGECQTTNGNFKIGGKKFFITEACEYKDNFLKFNYNTAIISNVEMDHPDYYQNIDDVYKSFSKFANKSKNLCIINEKYKHLLNINQQSITFNLNGTADYYGTNITVNNNKLNFDCYKSGVFFDNYSLSVHGKYNVLNAIAAIITADYYGLSKEAIKTGLSNFKGIRRRFEQINSINNCPIVHDYAHHPTEIQATLQCAREVFDKKIICVFQPHTFSRTKKLYVDFLNCFKNCEEIIILKTYAAREKNYEGTSAKKLATDLRPIYHNVKYFNNFNSVYKYLKTKLKPCNALLIIGAGSVEQLAEKFRNAKSTMICNKYDFDNKKELTT